MTKPSQSGFKRFFYNQNIKRDKSGKKYKNLINHYILLIKRVEKNGMDARLLDALSKAKKKIVAYGIALYQIEAVLKQRGLDGLIGLFQTTFAGEAKPKKIIIKKTAVIVETKKTPAKKVAKEISKDVDSLEEKSTKTPVKKVAKAVAKTDEKKTTTKKAPAKKTAEKKTVTKAKTTK